MKTASLVAVVALVLCFASCFVVGSSPTCFDKKDCRSCTAVSLCGWCELDGACIPGTEVGPFTGSRESNCSLSLESWHFKTCGTARLSWLSRLQNKQDAEIGRITREKRLEDLYVTYNSNDLALLRQNPGTLPPLVAVNGTANANNKGKKKDKKTDNSKEAELKRKKKKAIKAEKELQETLKKLKEAQVQAKEAQVELEQAEQKSVIEKKERAAAAALKAAKAEQDAQNAKTAAAKAAQK